MNFFLFGCAFVITFLTVDASIANYPADPAHPGKCYSEDTGELTYGEEKTVKDCKKANCNNDGTMELASCVAANSSCGLTPEDPSKSYPDCCPQPKPC